MKHLLLILILLVFAAGCQQPSGVELVTPPEEDLEITAIAGTDTAYARPSVDSSAVLPGEHDAFPGLLTVNKIKYDATGSVSDSLAFSRVFLADRLHPVQVLGRTVGYPGFDLGPSISLNGTPVLRLPHVIPIRRVLLDTIILAGYEYVVPLTTTYQANTEYRWIAQPSVLSGFNIVIRTPDELIVESPRGGSIVSRNEDLELRWRGQGGQFWIIVSKVEPISRRVIPLLRLQPRVNRGYAIVPSKVLRALPRDQRYVLTFVLANRSQATVDGYPDRILVQAASVYNSYVEIR